MESVHQTPIETTSDGLRTVSVASTAYYGIQFPETGLDADTRVLIVLHGWGQNSRSFLRKFASLARHNILVVAPQAPHQFYLDQVTRKVGFGWLTSFERDRGIALAVSALDAILDQVELEAGRPLLPLLLGFSQGVSMAWRYAIHGAHNASGVVVCGGDLPPDVEEALPGWELRPILVVHGVNDAIVPVAKGEAAEVALRGLGFLPETMYFDGGHDLPDTLLERLPSWMREA